MQSKTTQDGNKNNLHSILIAVNVTQNGRKHFIKSINILLTVSYSNGGRNQGAITFIKQIKGQFSKCLNSDLFPKSYVVGIGEYILQSSVLVSYKNFHDYWMQYIILQQAWIFLKLFKTIARPCHSLSESFSQSFVFLTCNVAKIFASQPSVLAYATTGPY